MEVKHLLNNVKTIKDIIKIINESDFSHIKTYIEQLNNISLTDAEDKLHVGSLKSFVLFLLNNPTIRVPKVNITPNGYVDARWDNTDTIVMEFLPNNEISLAIVKNRSSYRRKYISKRISIDDVMNNVSLN